MMREMMKGLGMKKSVGVDGDRGCNWNSERRLREQEADGWVVEVVLPSAAAVVLLRWRRREAPRSVTTSSTGGRAGRTTVGSRLRVAGAGAPRRVCPDLPGRRRGPRSSGPPSLRGGIVRGAPPGSASSRGTWPSNEPIWAACEANEMPVNHHSGGGMPLRTPPVSTAMFMLEVTRRIAPRHLMFSGVFERHPPAPRAARVDPRHMARARQLRPYWLWLGSVLRWRGRRKTCRCGRAVPALAWSRGRSSCGRSSAISDRKGIENIMWGVDYPHNESQPYTKVHLRAHVCWGAACLAELSRSSRTRRSSTVSTSRRWRRSRSGRAHEGRGVFVPYPWS